MNTETTLKTKRTDIMLVDPRNLVIEEGFNKRSDYGDIPALALSIVQFGMIEAVKAHKVRGEEKYIVTDGHRRQAALMLAMAAMAMIKKVNCCIFTTSIIYIN